MRTPVKVLVAGLAGLSLAAAALGYHAWGQAAELVAQAKALTGGDPSAGPSLMRQHGCAGCHQIPGVRGAVGRVGPPLAGIAERVYLGGVLRNEPDNMVQWLMDPRAIDDKTAMPATGLSEDDARHIAAYLYTLR